MAEVIDATYALRSANHLYTRLASQGVPEEDLDRLRNIREFIRGMAALEAMMARHGDDPG